MWKNYEVDESMEYKVALCQSPEGRRYFQLVEVEKPYINEGLVSMTNIVPYSLLFRRDFKNIVESSIFNNGMSFGVDPHGIWLTQEEITSLHKGVPTKHIQWLNGMPPNFPPC